MPRLIVRPARSITMVLLAVSVAAALTMCCAGGHVSGERIAGGSQAVLGDTRLPLTNFPSRHRVLRVLSAHRSAASLQHQLLARSLLFFSSLLSFLLAARQRSWFGHFIACSCAPVKSILLTSLAIRLPPCSTHHIPQCTRTAATTGTARRSYSCT